MSVALFLIHIYGTAAAILCPFLAMAWWQTWKRYVYGRALLQEAYDALYPDQPLPTSPSAAESRSEQP